MLTGLQDSECSHSSANSPTVRMTKQHSTMKLAGWYFLKKDELSWVWFELTISCQVFLPTQPAAWLISDVPQTLKYQGIVWMKCYADVERVLFCYASYVSRYSLTLVYIQERFQHPGNQKLVLSCLFTFSKLQRHSNSTVHTQRT